ncbi:MAG: adenylate/guanylate cyclase domain-containing protein [Gammaproteobacteria bacterium]|nr:adenylate/guanylate cyclase domain-containing protein [Gammaproteobacteria bacterium]
MPKISKKLILPSLLLLAVVLAYALNKTVVFERLEYWTFDSRTQLLRQDSDISDDIAIILIDEASLKTMEPVYGRFPWPRSAYAELIEFLALASPKAVIFDILFPERQDVSEPGLYGRDDRQFISSTRQNQFVIHSAQLFHDETLELISAPMDGKLPLEFVGRFGFKNESEQKDDENNTYVLPMEALWQSAAGIGVVNIPPDIDGVYRQIHLFHEYEQYLFPSLSVSPLVHLKPEARSQEWKNELLENYGRSKFLINMYGEYHPYSIAGIFASLSSLREGDVEGMLINPAELEDKYVFIGASAVGLDDIKATSIDPIAPGVTIHASVLSNLLDDDLLKTIPLSITMLIGTLLGLGSLLLIMYGSRWYLVYTIPAVATSLYVVFAYYLFSQNIVINIIQPVTLALVAMLLGASYKAITEGKDRRRVKAMFSQYVSKAVLDELLDKYEDHISAGDGARQKVTILFSDIREFTNLSEKLSPEQVVDLLNIYLTEMSNIIMCDGGTIDKYIGDAIMAFWGAPIIIDDHADRSVVASIEMMEALDRVNAKLQERGYGALKIGIGLHTGYAVLGNIGSDIKLDYTVIGDAVNLASRVEGLTKQYGFPLLVTEDTLESLKSTYPFAIVDAVQVKGKEIPIKLYAIPVDRDGKLLKGNAALKEKSIMEQAFADYQSGNWSSALEKYQALENRILADKYISRCEHYIEVPPEGAWDGVFRHTSK